MEALDENTRDEFIKYLQRRGKSENTLRAYRSDLTIFLSTQPAGIDQDDYEDLAMDWLNGDRTKAAPKTTGRRLTSLRSFAKWAGWGNVLDDYSTPTPAKSIPHPLPEGVDGVRRLIYASRNESEASLVALCGLLGCRVAEALAVVPSDFNLEEMTLSIRGKGDKTRIVPISPEAWDVMVMTVTRAFCNGGAPVVGMTDRRARRTITRLGVKASLRRHISSHDLRATFATEVYNKTMDIRLVQELLGHSSVETTQGYTGIQMSKMREGVAL
jgi:site-specific recombinase XerD